MAPYVPPEIWALVAGHLSPGVLASLGPDSGKASSWHGSLANLCLASRTLHDLATPRLYECPVTRNTEAFMRTLFARPDLARLVKCLRHGTWNDWYGMSTTHDVPEFTDLLMEHIERLEERVEMDEPPMSYMAEEVDQMIAVASDDDTEPQVNDSVALSLLPGLERIHLSSHFMPVCASSLPGSLPCLRQAVITNPGPDPFILPRHLAYVALAAPNLSVLRVDALEGVDATMATADAFMPTFPNVTTLHLSDANIQTQQYLRILKAFPRLTDLRCEPEHESQSGDTLSHLVRILPRIKRLHFDASAFPARNEDTPSEPESEDSPWASGLAELKELEYLATDVASLVKGRETAPAETVLSSILPISLQKLVISCPLTADIRHLGLVFQGLAKTAPSSLPVLRTVRVKSVSGSICEPAVARAFSDGGIVFEELKLEA